MLLELWVSSWTSRDDGIPAELEESLHENGRFDELPEDVAFPHDFDSALLTKAGGAPYWTANGPYLLDPSDRLVLQLRGPGGPRGPRGKLSRHRPAGRRRGIDRELLPGRHRFRHDPCGGTGDLLHDQSLIPPPVGSAPPGSTRLRSTQPGFSSLGGGFRV